MKKLLFLLISICTAFAASAQWGGYIDPSLNMQMQMLNQAMMQQMQQQAARMQQQMWQNMPPIQQAPPINWNAVPMNIAPQTQSSSNNEQKSLEERRKDNLNRGAGENCLHCKGTKKCPTCKGTKVRQAFGNTFECTTCERDGSCPICHGTGKTPWNR